MAAVARIVSSKKIVMACENAKFYQEIPSNQMVSKFFFQFFIAVYPYKIIPFYMRKLKLVLSLNNFTKKRMFIILFIGYL